MDSAGRSPDKPESLPPTSSLINKLSTVFGRNWSASPAPARTAVLTSYKTKEDTDVGERKQCSTDAKAKGELENCEDTRRKSVAASSDVRRDVRSGTSSEEPNNHDKSVNSDLLLATMVETYSDVEDDNDEEMHAAAAKMGGPENHYHFLVRKI